MNNFVYYNPTRIIFGEGSIEKLDKYVPSGATILMCYGGGSIKRNGVYDQVIAALNSRRVIEFGGFEANPEYDTLLKAIDLGREQGVDFVLAVGGGSVIDGAKLVAAAISYQEGEPWDIVTGKKTVRRGETLPLATVLTIPATGSEMNPTAVISRRSMGVKTAFVSEANYPVFSILDPRTTFSLPTKQVRNGIVDAYIHVLEQYITYPVNALLQDRQAEAILSTLQEIALAALQSPPDYEARANLMWSATNALNKLINKGVPEDFSTHLIGHEITAIYGLAHAESLVVVMPYLYSYKREQKAEKLAQYGRRVWGLTGEDDAVIDGAIGKLTAFFQSLGMPTTLTHYGIDPDEAAVQIQTRFEATGRILGERKDIYPADVAAILRMSR